MSLNAPRLPIAFVALCLCSSVVAVCAEDKHTPSTIKNQSVNTDTGNEHEQYFSSELMRQLEGVKAAALADEYAYQRLAQLTENIGPRPSGSAGAKAAVEYVAAQMRQLGLEVQLEEIKVRHWVRGVETAELVDVPQSPAGTQQRIVLTALGGSTSTGPSGITAEVIVVNDFDQLKTFGRKKIAGKIVLFNKKFDSQKAEAGLAYIAYRETVAYREAGPKAAAELGAVAALVRSIGSADYRLAHTGDSDPAGIPAGAVSTEDAELIAHLSTQGPVHMHLALTPQKLPDETSYNVIGDWKGSEHPEQIVIVSGHLDSWDLGTGALDDGAGVVVAMEAVKIMKQLHLPPHRTLRVVAWMDEETDGAGSSQYQKDYKKEFPQHIAAIESDGGAAHPLGFFTKISKDATDSLAPVQTVLSSIGATVLQDAPHPPGITDIAPMSEQGVPILGIMQDERKYFNYHHTAADTLDKVVPSELRENAAAMAVMAYALTNMTNPLPRR